MNKLDYYLNKFPIVLLYLLICFFSSHQIISKYIFYYKEFFSLIFLILSTIYFFYHKLRFSDLIFKTKIYIFLFPYSILICLFIFNTGTIDPEFTKSSTILNNDTTKNFLLLYTIRNFTILLPVVFFFSLRGINENEINRILSFLVFVGFIGLIIYQIYRINFIDTTLYHYFYNNNHFSEYNTYIPYISGLYAISLYIAIKEKNNFYFILLTIINSSFLYVIFFSSAKSSLLFCFISLIYFMVIFFNKKLVFFLLAKIMILFLFHNLINFYHIDYKKKILNSKKEDKYELMKYYQLDKDKFIYPLINKQFRRLSLQTRIDVYKSFFNYTKETSLSEDKFYFGTGSLSSTFSGFHNDYMRIFYRVGIIGLISAFIPFFYLFFKFTKFSLEKFFFKNKNKKPDFIYLLTVLIGFTLYYSFFAYPREDVYQSSIIWISLILIYGYLNHKVLFNKN